MVDHRRQRRVDGRQDRGRGAPAGVLLDQGVRPALQRQVPRRQVLPLARGDGRRGVPAGDGRPRRQAQGHRYFGPYSHAWAIRETVDQLLRVFPMRSCSNGVFKRSGQIGRPCLLGYIDKCSAPCVGNDQRRGPPRDRRRLLRLHGGSTNAFVKRIATEMYAASDALDFEKAARLRDDLGALEKALEKQAVVLRRRHRRRRDRPGRGPARGRGPDLLRPRRPDPRPARLGGRPRRRGRHPRAGRGLPAPALRRRQTRDDDPARDPGARAAARPGDDRGSCSASCGAARSRIRVPQRGDKHSLQETVARNAGQALVHAQDQARHRPDRPQPGARGDPAGARPRRGAAAHRVLRHLQPPGHRGGRLDGGLRGRPGPQERVPPLRDQGRRRPERRRARCTRSSPGGSAGCSTSRPGRPRWRPRPARCWSTPRPAGPASSPTRPVWSSSTAARRRSPPRSARSTSSASTTSRSAAWPSGSRRSGCPAGGPGHPGPHQRGALPAPAGPRRGPPVRDHPPPVPAQQVDGREPARRRARPGRGAPQDPAQALRLAAQAAGRHGRGDRAWCPASASAPPRR